MHTSTMVARTKTPLARLKCSHSMHPRARAATPMPAAHPPARGTHLGPRRDVGAVLQQRLHHRSMPARGGKVQAGPPVLESRRAVSGGATATREASAGGDALPRRAPCTPDTHQRKHAATGHACAALHPSLYLASCTHLHAYHGAHTHGMQALARTPQRQRQLHARGTYLGPCGDVGAVL